MRISSINTNQSSAVSFCKQLVATCRIKTDGSTSSNCNIYELSRKDDLAYFYRLLTTPEWKNGKFVGILNQSMLSPVSSISTKAYSIEDTEGKCLGYVSTLSDSNKKERIQYIETCPEHTHENKKRKTKYVGQSLMAFIVGLADKKGINRVCVPIPTSSAKDFYSRKCLFRKDPEKKDGYIIEKQDYHKFLDKHNKKVGSEIVYIV